jgi:hypothetical protein
MPSLCSLVAFWIFAANLSLIINAQDLPVPRVAVGRSAKPRKAFSLTQMRNPNWMPREIPVTAIYAAPFLKHHLRMPEPLKEAVDELNSTGLGNSTSLKHKRANGQKAVGTNGL